jgi:beta-lactamase class A
VVKKIFYVLLLIATFLAAFFWGKNSRSARLPNQTSRVTALRLGQDGLISPLVEYEISENVYREDLASFDDKIQKLVNDFQTKKMADTVSVYFRSLYDGPWFGIKPDDSFFPASLLKVPIMVAYFKMAETNPSLLTKKITYDEGYQKLGNFNEDQYFKSEKTIQPGQTYTVEELIEYMIKYSDNNAKNILVMNFDDMNQLFQVYVDLGIATPPELKTGEDVLSVHEFATFFRVLFNASYLSKEMSKKALELLTQTTFNLGIKEGVPDKTTVADKFGEHTFDDIKQLHDCGIVYHPGNPYILCIMTRGSNFDSLEKVISGISKAVYDNVNGQKAAGDY